MSPLASAVALSVVSAVAYALAAVAQVHAAAEDRPMVSRWIQPSFVLAVALNAVGAGLHVLALRYGSLAVVQPLGALTLVFALPVGAAFGGRRVSGREWWGVWATLAGLTGLLLTVDTGVPTEALHDHEIVALTAVTAAVLVACTTPGGGSLQVRGLRLALGSGIAFGVGSVLTQTLVLRIPTLQAKDVLSLPVLGTALTIGGFVVAGLLLAQAAYRTGLGAPLATLTIVNPVYAAGIGVVLLGQGSAVSAGEVLVALVAALVAARGIVLTR